MAALYHSAFLIASCTTGATAPPETALLSNAQHQVFGAYTEPRRRRKTGPMQPAELVQRRPLPADGCQSVKLRRSPLNPPFATRAISETGRTEAKRTKRQFAAVAPTAAFGIAIGYAHISAVGDKKTALRKSSSAMNPRGLLVPSSIGRSSAASSMTNDIPLEKDIRIYFCTNSREFTFEPTNLGLRLSASSVIHGRGLP
jgi:hypothetical protein